jgi:membrane-associated phospholipid phosphatase
MGPLSWAVALVPLLLGATLALTVLAARSTPLPGDAAILRWGQGLPFPGEGLSQGVRAITGTQAVLATGAVLALLLGLVGRRLEALVLLAGLVLLPLLQSGIKELVDRPRPGPPWSELRGGFSSPSFPAGHVMSPTALYGYLLWLAAAARVPTPWRWPLGLWSALLLVGAGPPNVWLGVHWPSDVLGGWGWGLLLALALAATVEVLAPRGLPRAGPGAKLRAWRGIRPKRTHP